MKTAVLEFKGRSESARVADIDLLIEVGLGIHRRLREQEPDVKMPRSEISFWYLANHLGNRFLRDALKLTGEFVRVGAGLWRGRVLERPLWLVSNRDVAIDEESAPVSMVSEQSPERVIELAGVASSSESLWDTYGPLLTLLYPHQRKEFEDMATKPKLKKSEWGYVIWNAINASSPEELLKGETARAVIDKIGLDGFLAALTPEQRRELGKRLEGRKK